MDRKLEWLDGYFEETRSVSGTEWAVIRNSCRSQQEAMGGRVLIAAEPPACPGKTPSTKNEREPLVFQRVSTRHRRGTPDRARQEFYNENYNPLRFIPSIHICRLLFVPVSPVWIESRFPAEINRGPHPRLPHARHLCRHGGRP
jgi:hypothetical protein